MEQLFHINKPYPQPVNLSENKKTGILLLKAYTGVVSEMTDVNRYMYHYLMALADYQPIAAVFRGIAEVELRHLYLLGNVINQLGVRPKLRTVSDNTPKAWTSKNIVYGRDVKEMLSIDMTSERSEIAQYEQIIKRTSNTQIHALLLRLIEDERLHIEILNDAYNRYF